MGFTFSEARKQAFNTMLSFPTRWSCAKRCIWKYAQYTEQEFTGALERIGYIAQIPLPIIHAFPVHNSITEQQLSYAIEVTVAERERYITKYNRYRMEREREKRNGRLRAPELYRIFLVKPDHYDAHCVRLAPYRPLYSQKYGYLNEQGELSITPQFDRAEPFVGDTAQVLLQSERYHISPTGEIIGKI